MRSLAFFMKPELPDLCIVAFREWVCFSHFKGRRQIDRYSENERVLLGQRRQSFQNCV